LKSEQFLKPYFKQVILSRKWNAVNEYVLLMTILILFNTC
jgi:hypothetical protein